MSHARCRRLAKPDWWRRFLPLAVAVVFGVAAELDRAVEIDSYPDRQNLDLALIKLAGKAECRISLGTDAHGPTQLRFIELRAATAMFAEVKRDRILNFIGRESLVNWAKTVR
jgi:histidinol phosphatase-like PHP family hydrolase